ncbi:VanW family protein [Paenibacillus sp. BSR1-1]|uniref:VanW family protein n=1 Tax=Paenibacillus sp. BSR1-1 TaxID=3020845 RepID=UPI0025AF98D6|nr:VanW family protein [Paenibacillus sp. BSR1-1]MDN3018977.1 VanW family protein [Paenibacillus sp. BSR1-1]
MNFSWLFGLVILSQQMNVPGSLVITNNSQPIPVHTPTYFSMNFPILPILDTEKLNKFMDEIDLYVTKNPKNAIIDKNGNIIPEQVGYRLNRQVFTENIFSYYFNNGSSNLEVPLAAIYPRVDSELLGNIRGEKIGEYITFFNSNNKERNNNIYLAANAINNFVLFPGEIFSFNNVVGERTAGKGYMPATVIVKGEYSEDFGGGICQVSSTLFNAVDNAGLKVVKRYSHSREVSYVPPKRDATVSWNGPDLIFKNEYKQPILILAKSLENKLKVEIYSSDVITYSPKKVPYLPYQKHPPK